MSDMAPGHVPIVLARKPLAEKTIAANVLRYGTGAINVDATRIEGVPPKPTTAPGWDSINQKNADGGYRPGAYQQGGATYEPHTAGRWPGNVLLDPEAAALLDEMSGERKSGGYPAAGGQRSHVATYGKPNERGEQRFTASTGGASRFFFTAPHDDPEDLTDVAPMEDTEGMTILHGDCRAVMAAMEPNSVDAIVCDPPYDLTNRVPDVKKCRDCQRVLGGADGKPDVCPRCGGELYNQRSQANGGGGFMGKKWDATGIAFDPATWAEAMRVLKPGGHLVAFGGTRTSHRMVCAIEDAGFEIRDSLVWMYGSGFPKSANVSKMIDKQAGAERDVIGDSRYASRRPNPHSDDGRRSLAGGRLMTDTTLTAPATDAAKQWDGWGSALKPAHEPIVLARKPLGESTIAGNVLAWGTGALNIDATRIGTGGDKGVWPVTSRVHAPHVLNASQDGSWATPSETDNTCGRWPPNVLMDETAAAKLDAMSGESTSRAGNPNRRSRPDGTNTYFGAKTVGAEHNDTGGASRFMAVMPAPIDDPDAEHTRQCLICARTYAAKHGIMNATKESVSCDHATTAATISHPTEKHNDSAHDPAPALLPLGYAVSNQSSNGSAKSAVSTSRNMPPTPTPTAPENALDVLTASLAPRVSDAGNLCDSCATATAQSLAAILHGQNPASLRGLDFITASRNSILIQSLASYAEPLVNTGIIPTTASLSILFGSVQTAMQKCTLSGETASDLDRVRFRYVSKASRRERNAGLDGLPTSTSLGPMAGRGQPGLKCKSCGRWKVSGNPCTCPDPEWEQSAFERPAVSNTHSTVKPIALMRWLCRLITPPGGVILDPFAGSGTTGCAAALEGFQSILIEQEAEYIPIIERRVAYWQGKTQTATAAPVDIPVDDTEEPAPIVSRPVQMEIVV
jgi:DNA modification methylase